MKEFLTTKTALKGMSLAMGIFSSFFSTATYPQQNDIQQTIIKIKTETAQIAENISSHSQETFKELQNLTHSVALLNAVVRKINLPESELDDLLQIDLMLAHLADDIRRNYATQLRQIESDRAVFKAYLYEQSRFNLFAIKMRQDLGRYVIVPSPSKFTQADLDELIADSNKRYGING